MVITDKKTGRKLEFGNCYHIDILGEVRACTVLGKCKDKDRPWYGQYEIKYTDKSEAYANGEDLFIKFGDVVDSFFRNGTR